MDNKYACPELFAILQEGLNLLAEGTCWKNRKGFPGKDARLTAPRAAERGELKRLCNRHFHMISMQWKDSKVLQFISTFMIAE
eukprot:8116203-Ditylum_brightwellii.AAC.1